MDKESGTITIKKEAMWKYATFGLLAILIIGAIVYMLPGESGNIDNKGAVQLPSEVKASIDDDDAVLGDADAPVTIIEFSDYQCPYCGLFNTQTRPQIIDEYVDTGKVKLVFRDFPLTSIHPQAQAAAEATECVRDLGGDDAFWEMHDTIFENQQTISDDNLKSWAKDLGYDIDSCLDSGKFRSEVQKDSSDAQAAGGRGTPYFVINGRPLSGAQPFSAFQQVIEAELAK